MTSKVGKPSMEGDLYERDRVGVQDFLLLEDFSSENVFIDNLQRRFNKDLIYTYLGQVLISVNPFKELCIYSELDVNAYRNKHLYEIPPHIFAVTGNAFRSLIDENVGQCILISGESGSGKTEASKKVLKYIAACSGDQNTVNDVKNKLLKSNPILESFGNAKTKRNENSSRFGKYMDIQFDFTGAPIGGNILNYMLEKSRVISQNPGERNFHIFYQLLAGATDQMLNELQLTRSIDTYNYLGKWDNAVVGTITDARNFETILHALSVTDFSPSTQKKMFNIVGSILHLGNIDFKESDHSISILNPITVAAAAKLLQIDAAQLTSALTQRTIEAQGDFVTSPLSREMAFYARNALAKAIYDRLFSWLVAEINFSIQAKNVSHVHNHVMGILDIYGFEIFEKNCYEQFCINFCNEKLQQLFIELTLKSEQDEYRREEIEWVPVEYFDNKVICDLIEEKHRGIISILDEECLRPGEATETTFIEKLKVKLATHPHYICHEKASIQIQKTMGRDEFRLRHYAGDVTYNVNGFLDKNNDLLFRDLKETMSVSKNNIMQKCFPEDEYKSKKRPDTAMTQFKQSLNSLIGILMCKEPSYVRCIKPNDSQSSNCFDTQLVLHQVKYLGLMENLRVRRAGFAYRRTYEMFLGRYKCLTKLTWPNFNGPAKEGVKILIKELKFASDEYRLGVTKLFIRFPRTLFATEDVFQIKKHDIATIIQCRWKGRVQRLTFLKLRNQIINLQSFCRRYLAKRNLQKRREAAIKIQAFIKGFITRNEACNGYNEPFIAYSKRMWLLRLSKQLPQKLFDKSWPSAPSHCQETSDILYKIHRSYLARDYRLKLTVEEKHQFELKALAEKIFKGKKSNYHESLSTWFQSDRIPKQHVSDIDLEGEHLTYASPCTKYDRHGYKSRARFIVLSNVALYILDGKSYKRKHRLPLEKIDLVITNHSDDLVIIRIPPEFKRDKGDLILMVPHIIEFCTFVLHILGNYNVVKIVNRDSLEHNVVKGKSGVIDIQTGNQPGVTRNKSGHLVVVASQ